MQDTNTLIIKTPLSKRALVFCLSAGFFGIGILLIFKDSVFAGLAIAAFGFLGLVVAVRRPLVVLAADATGLQVRKYKKIPWSEVKNIYAVVQKMRGDQFVHLAIELHNPDFLTKDSTSRQMVTAATQTLAGNTMSDKGSAQLYIGQIELPGKSVDEIATQLMDFKARVESTTSPV